MRVYMKKVTVISDTKQKFNGIVYYKCGEYFQKNDKRLHRKVWLYHFGKIPKGLCIHHIDENKENNQIDNLSLMTKKKHTNLHLFGKPKQLSEKCLLEAAKWHKSKEGKEWHKEHYEENKDNLHKDHKRYCMNCDKRILSRRKNQNTFCSGACKTKYRRRQGLDNIEKECEICSTLFTSNKYDKTKTCSRKCTMKLISRKKLIKLNKKGKVL